jgi:predicted amidohydrolase
MQDLIVSAIQFDLAWEDVSKNLETATKMILDAPKSDIYILPEMFTTGFSMNPEKVYTLDLTNDTKKMMISLSKKLDAAITFSIMDKNDDGQFVNRLYWIESGFITHYYDKVHLFSMGEENNHFSPGNHKLVFSFKEWKICCIICYDLRFPVFIRNKEDFDLLICVANWPDKRIHTWDTLLQARAIENQCYVVGVNRVGVDANQINYVGHSMLIDPQGIVLNSNSNDSITLTTELFQTEITKTRRYLPFLKDMDNFTLNQITNS